MKSCSCALLFTVLAMLGESVLAQPILMEKAEKLFDFAQLAEPTVLTPPAGTRVLYEADNYWYLRHYPKSDTYIAVNVEGNGPLFFAGDVYVLGGPFGDRPVYIDNIDSLLTVVDTFDRQKELLSSMYDYARFPGRDQCIAVNRPAQGLRARHYSPYHENLGLLNFFTTNWLEVSPARVVRQVHFEGLLGNKKTVIDEEITTLHETSNGLLLSSFESNLQRSAVSYSGRVADRWEGATTSHYDAFRLEGPDSVYCLGELLYTSQVREKTLWTSGFSSYGTGFFKALGHYHLVVNAIDERITVPAGTFDTVVITRYTPHMGPPWEMKWIDPTTGLEVRSARYSRDGTETDVEVLLEYSH